MKRRTFFLRTGAAVCVATVGSLAYVYTQDDPANGIFHPFIEEFLSDEDLEKIAKAHLSKEKNVPDVQEQSPDKLRNSIIEDFNGENIEICDGWVLSKTEINHLVQKMQNETNS
ncbi:hypothetical protein [Maribacter sp. 2210JD10-5]|uniref:hypothetical protein n=1 Tax=Maribacter sp. 2210JD10-5 TaxID=3386272 RepID=UPI0039BC3224